MSYNDYLQSEDWKLKRAQKNSKNKRCGICGTTENVHVHHLNYRNLVDVKQTDLRKLCKRCHFLAHDLIRAGKIKFKSSSHHSMWASLKYGVKKELGITKVNCFV